METTASIDGVIAPKHSLSAPKKIKIKAKIKIVTLQEKKLGGSKFNWKKWKLNQPYTKIYLSVWYEPWPIDGGQKDVLELRTSLR